MKKFKQIFDPNYLKPLWKWKPQRVFKFTWEYCENCDVMFVRCPKCGNNCCNGGFGRVDKNTNLPTVKWDKSVKTCDVCNLAYMYQRMADETKSTPKKKYEKKPKM